MFTHQIKIVRSVLGSRSGCDADVRDLGDVPPGVPPGLPLPLTGAVD